jgi:hypothetical protein
MPAPLPGGVVQQLVSARAPAVGHDRAARQRPAGLPEAFSDDGGAIVHNARAAVEEPSAAVLAFGRRPPAEEGAPSTLSAGARGGSDTRSTSQLLFGASNAERVAARPGQDFDHRVASPGAAGATRACGTPRCALQRRFPQRVCGYVFGFATGDGPDLRLDLCRREPAASQTDCALHALRAQSAADAKPARSEQRR